MKALRHALSFPVFTHVSRIFGLSLYIISSAIIYLSFDLHICCAASAPCSAEFIARFIAQPAVLL